MLGELNPIEDADGFDGAGFGSEPALVGQVGGKNLLEEFEAGAGEQAIEGGSEEFEGALAVFDGDGFGSLGGGLEFEPEEGIGRECKRVGRAR